MIKLLVRLAYFATLIIQGLIGVRIVLTIINADLSNDLAKWIVDKTDILISPFNNIIDSTINIGPIHIPAVLLVALVFYMIGGIVISELLKSYRGE